MASITNKALAVTIVIPVYNEEHHLKTCLQAISAQTTMPVEVIVVDNNSSDGSVKVARQFPFVRVLHEKKQGIVFARNTGFDAVKSGIIGRIDADTVLPPDWVAQVQRFYQDSAHRHHALTGGCVFYNVRWPRLAHWVTSQFVFRMNRLLMGHYVLWGSNMALPARLWQVTRATTCQDTDIHEDLDLAIHLHRLDYRVTYQATLRAGARMNRVFERRVALWPNLLMWPRTLRRHNLAAWPLSLGGAVFLYVTSVIPPLVEQIGRLFGRPLRSQSPRIKKTN